MSVNRLQQDVVHPKPEATRPTGLGSFSKSIGGARSIRVADMIMAFNAKSEGDHRLLKRTSSTGSMSPLSDLRGSIRHSDGSHSYRSSVRRMSDDSPSSSLSLSRGVVVVNRDQGRDGSEDEDEDGQESGSCRMVQKNLLTQSLGRNERSLSSSAVGGMTGRGDGGVLCGKVLRIPREDSDEEIDVDDRVQKTFAHFKKGTVGRQQVATVTKVQAKSPVIKPIGVTTTGRKGFSPKRTGGLKLQGSPRRSPARTTSATKDSTESSQRSPARATSATKNSTESSQRSPARATSAAKSSTESSQRSPARTTSATKSSTESSQRSPARTTSAAKNSTESPQRSPARTTSAAKSSTESPQRSPARTTSATKDSTESQQRSPARTTFATKSSTESSQRSPARTTSATKDSTASPRCSPPKTTSAAKSSTDSQQRSPARTTSATKSSTESSQRSPARTTSAAKNSTYSPRLSPAKTTSAAKSSTDSQQRSPARTTSATKSSTESPQRSPARTTSATKDSTASPRCSPPRTTSAAKSSTDSRQRSPTKDSTDSQQHSPAKTTSATKDSTERTPSPRRGDSVGKSKIESNPFFQQDQLNHPKSRVAALKTQERRSSVPSATASKNSDETIAVGMEGKKESAVSKSTEELAESRESRIPDRSLSPRRRADRSSSPSWTSLSSAETTPSRGRPGSSVNIQQRIKMWTDKEKEGQHVSSSPQTPVRKSPENKEVTSPSSKELEGTQNSSPKRKADEGDETAQPEMDDVYDDVVHPSVPRSSQVVTKRKVSREQVPETSAKNKEECEDVIVLPSSQRKDGPAEGEEEYEDIIVPSSQRKDGPAEGEEEYEDIIVPSSQSPNHPAPPLPTKDDVYEDMDTSTTSRVPLPSAERKISADKIDAESDDVLSEDLYTTIPGEMFYENPLEESEEVPPELPPRPVHLTALASKKAVVNGVTHENGDDVYEDLDQQKASQSDSPSSKHGLLKGKDKMQEKEASPKHGRSKLSQLFRSPILTRRKKIGERGISLEGKEQKTDDEEKSVKIASRSSKKRTAIRKRPLTATSSNASLSDETPTEAEPEKRAHGSENEDGNECEDVFVSKSSSDLNAGSATVEPLQGDLDASAPQEEDNAESYVTVTGKKLDPHTQKFVSFTTDNIDQPSRGSDVGDKDPPKAAKGTSKRKLRKDRTLSKEIFDIINSMGGEEEEFLSTTSDGAADEQFSRTAPEGKFLPPSSISDSVNIKTFLSDPALHGNVDRSSSQDHSERRNHLVVPKKLRGRSCSSPQPFQDSMNSPMISDISGDSGSDIELNGFVCNGEPPIQSNLDCGERRPSHKPYHVRKQKSAVTSSFKETYLSANSPIALRRGSLTPSEEGSDGVIATSLMYADALWDHATQEGDELSFRVGDVIEILDMTDDVWWHGSKGEASGWFPSSFVRLRIGQESDSDDAPTTTAPEDEHLARTHPPTRTGSSIRRRMTIRRRDTAPNIPKKLSPSEVRAKVVEEILNTERDYVQHLEDIVEGFLKRCREYNTLFDAEKVETIFSNIEHIYEFQRDFLKELEARVNMDRMEESQIGEVFVINRHEFAIYSEYCNNHPHTVNEMNTLQQNEQYAFFFESCRLLRNLQDISLEGFLLTPVQKICKYPLQLFELLKYTSDDHPDYPHVVAAQQAMKEVAMLINEQKRRMENIGKIGRWQETIENWKGDDILDMSTEMVHSGELHKISKGHSQERHFFLFDHQLVYCKKDTIGGKLAYKGRLDLDNCQIVDLPDGFLHGNTQVKNAWRMNNIAKDKWIVIFAKNSEIKKQWMDAFQRERDRVKEDMEKGFNVCMRMKRAAVTLGGTAVPVSRRRRKSFSKKHIQGITESVDGVGRQRIDSSSSAKKLIISTPSIPTTSNKKVKGKNRKTVY